MEGNLLTEKGLDGRIIMIWFLKTQCDTVDWVEPDMDKLQQYALISVTNLMHNYFILKQYVCYIIILDMFRALTCPSSGG